MAKLIHKKVPFQEVKMLPAVPIGHKKIKKDIKESKQISLNKFIPLSKWYKIVKKRIMPKIPCSDKISKTTL